MRSICVGLLIGVPFVATDALMAQCATRDAWAQIPPLPIPLDQTCSASVDGKIYVIGGRNGSAESNSVFCWDPASQLWTQRTSMPTPRGMAACATVGGVIFVIGGNDCSQNCWLATVEAYNPSTDSWTTGLASLPSSGCGTGGRGLHSAVAVDGKIYVMGGADSYCSPSASARVDIYDVATNTWNDGKSDSGVSLPRLRSQHGSVAVDRRIYLIGGWSDSSGGLGETIKEVDVFNTNSGTWESCPPMSIARGMLGVVEAGGKVYAIGGFDLPLTWSAYSVVEELDLQWNCWRRVSTLPVAQGWGTAVSVGNWIYVLGGTNPSGKHQPITSCWQGAPRPIPGDLDGDSDIDMDDLLILINQWT